MFYCKPCDVLSCQSCDETLCMTCWDRGERSGCQNCYGFCTNCKQDTCVACAFHCNIGECDHVSCKDCSMIIDSCILCNDAISNPVCACYHCTPHACGDDVDVCEDCQMFDTVATLSDKTEYFDTSIVDVPNIITLKACLFVWKVVTDAASYAPGGAGYKRTREEFERSQKASIPRHGRV